MVNSEDYSIILEIVNSVATVYGWKDFYTPVFKAVTTLPKTTLESIPVITFWEKKLYQ